MRRYIEGFQQTDILAGELFYDVKTGKFYKQRRKVHEPGDESLFENAKLFDVEQKDQVIIKMENGVVQSRGFTDSTLVKELKQDDQLLIFKDRILEDSARVIDCAIDEELYLVTNRSADQFVNAGEVDYCSIFLSQRDTGVADSDSDSVSDSVRAKIIKLLFHKEYNGVEKMETITLYCHPDCPDEMIKKMVSIELDEEYFKTADLDFRLLPRMSKEAILRYHQYTMGVNRDKPKIKNHHLYALVDEAIRREEQTRLSTGVQLEFERVERLHTTDWMDVALRVQEGIAAAMTKNDEEKRELLYLMRTEKSTHTPHWRKYNRASRGFFPLDSQTPDCLLWDPATSCYQTLHNELAKNKLTIVAAGSVS